MRKILVTGGNGLLGRYVVEALEQDSEITIADRKGEDPRQAHGPVDVLDLKALRHYMAGQDTIVHLAAIDAAIPVTADAYFKTNIMAAWNVFHAGYEAGIRHFVLCSSSSVYGIRGDALGAPPQSAPIDESHPQQASDPYGLSKRACETVAEGFSRRVDMSVTVLRPCFIAYPFEVPRMRAIHAGDTKALGLDAPPLPPLNWFVSPEDTARAFRAAVEAQHRFEAFNISGRDTFSAKPTPDRLKEIFGHRTPPVDQGHFAAQPFASPLNITKAKEGLGWIPSIDWATLRNAANQPSG